ncbi:MAG: AAA family ATPase [Thermoguttaceae bacterium]|jgi:predicted ABC-type ATPase
MDSDLCPKFKKVIIIAGPNGAGKTTFACEYLPREADCPEFINVDLIAAGLSPFGPERAALRAGRIMLQEIHQRIQRGESFAFETTLSGRNYIRLIPQWRDTGYHVKLLFLSLPAVELAIARVASRVAQGGHAVAEDTIRRRFDSGQRNFYNVYCQIVDSWILYDNSGSAPFLISCGDNP